MSRELTEKTKQIALDSGADLVGVVGVEDLAEHSEDIQKILPLMYSVTTMGFMEGRESGHYRSPG